MNKRQVRADLKRKAKAMLKDIVANLDRAINKLEQAGVLDDHDRLGQNWIVPKNFVYAFLRSEAEQYNQFPDSRESRARIRNYDIFL